MSIYPKPRKSRPVLPPKNLSREVTFKASAKKLFVWWGTEPQPFITFTRTSDECGWVTDGNDRVFDGMREALLYADEIKRSQLLKRPL